MLEELKLQENLNKDEIDKRSAEALKIVEDMRTFNKDGFYLIDDNDFSFIHNNYGVVFADLERDIEKYITYDNSNEQINSFLNELNQIKGIFDEIVPEDFNALTTTTIEKVLPEDHYKNTLSEYANEKVSDIIHTHNSYLINKAHKDLISRIESLEKNINPSDTERFKNIYGLLKEIKTENKIFDKPIDLTNKEATDNFLKTFKNISDNYKMNRIQWK